MRQKLLEPAVRQVPTWSSGQGLDVANNMPHTRGRKSPDLDGIDLYPPRTVLGDIEKVPEKRTLSAQEFVRFST